MLPKDVQTLWASTRLKDELVKFFQNLYKPASQYEQEKVEYNKINILAEYSLYNMTFCKNELMLDDFKTAAVCDIMWKLLEFDPDRGSRTLLVTTEMPSQLGVNEDKNGADNEEGTGFSIDREQEATFKRKYNLLK